MTSGQRLSQRYELLDLIAMGGMGEVWEATDLVLARTVAVKVLRPDVQDPAAAQRLRAEAQSAAMLSSDRVVKVFDSGEVTDDQGRTTPYLVMELVRGRSLNHVLADEVRLSPDRVAQLVGEVAEALREAHDAGLVHRDIKPANVLVTQSGSCKLTDFGISQSAGTAGLTATGLVMGTARYLSPEQVSGLKATSASDLYALGVIAHEALRGQPLFEAEGEVATALAHAQQQPPLLPGSTPAWLNGLVMAMLAKEPAERPDAHAVVAAVATAAAPAATMALPVVAPAPVRAAASHRRWWLAAPVAAAATALAFFSLASGDPTHPTPAGAAPAATPSRPSAPAVRAPALVPVARTTTRAPVAPAAPAPAPVRAKHAKGKGHHR